ncbi:Fe2+-dependent dioxygenase [Plastoroseomonas arctica]|uniref:Fe2+-dependent dioxygenase n=1 Tax=Plastoroseomonas arctica TaxID=1509237 RepID=A0AAF1JZ56_9PROT|nr:Fe2+-dependent dioxygenase [Plastoroseomonas arctica]MBR0657277.1 Fe2+-dependent dioxygenase [Plastoroseomonas arctica]
MRLDIPDVLSPNDLARMRELMAQAAWVDGKVTAGEQSATVKNNLQIPEGSQAHRELGDIVLAGLGRSGLFISGVLPHRVFPPLFNRYDPGMTFGAHVDNAIRQIPGTPHRIRTDVSCTLFLSELDDYEGGALTIEDHFGTHSVRLPAGHMVAYPASSLHRVEPITRGTRLACFFWVQSMVRDDGRRRILFDLDMAIDGLKPDLAPGHAAPVQLTAIYHNLLRQWADA